MAGLNRKRSSDEANGSAPKKARVDSRLARGHSRTPSVVRSSRGKPVINDIPELPTQKLNVYVFGSGTICELGLGPMVTEVKRPRINKFQMPDEVGVVALASGGAHTLTIDHEGKLWSWGQNDSGVLGRYTKETEDEADDDYYINSKESTPAKVEGLPAYLKFVSVAATDNLSVAITSEGHVWAWGTFSDEGDKAFKSGVEIQRAPVLMPSFTGIVQAAGGKEHMLFLDKWGNVYAWGIGSSFQLGQKINPRLRTKTFGPFKIPGLKNIRSIGAGEYHSFAIDTEDRLWSWGLNNFGQCFIPEGVGSGAMIEQPTLATFFDGIPIQQVDGGNHHSLLLTKSGDVYAVGEMNFHQLGIPDSDLPKTTVREASGAPSYVPTPTKLTAGDDSGLGDGSGKLPKMKFVACGTDHSMALSAEDGSAWTWGFGQTYQLGHGKDPDADDPDDEIIPKRIKNTATTDITMTCAAAGGQFSVLGGIPAEDVNMANGN